MALMAKARKLTDLSKRKKAKARGKTLNARERVLKEAIRKGVISNDRARAIGGWGQAWYHLAAMAKAGMLKRAGYNQWMPARRSR
jgi:hypothetical protein